MRRSLRWVGVLVVLQLMWVALPVKAYHEDPDVPYSPAEAFHCDTSTFFGSRACYAIDQFWNANGGLPVFGYAESPVFQIENPGTRTTRYVQLFERQRLEWDFQLYFTPYVVQLGRLGAELFQPTGELTPSDPGADHYIAETGFAIDPEFWGYWSGHGLELGDEGLTFRESLALFGYPISPPMPVSDGSTVTLVQWFERARFELHPANTPEYQVLLGRLGADYADQRGPFFDVIAAGLANPRGIWFNDEFIYVAEAGSGGAECREITGGATDLCAGLTGGVTVIGPMDDPPGRRFSDMPSIARPDGTFATGIASLQWRPGSYRYQLYGLDSDIAGREALGEGFSQLGHLTADYHEQQLFVDLAAFEAANNPDGGAVRSSPAALQIVGSELYIADAGGNSLLRVSPDGTIRVFAVFPAQQVEVHGTIIDIESRPSALTLGSDGAFYVGEMTSDPWPVGAARVWRVIDLNGDGDAQDAGETEVYEAGFTTISGLVFDHELSLNVLELSRNGLLNADGTPKQPLELVGALIRLSRSSGERQDLITTGELLIAPTAIAASPDGEFLYVTNYGVFPDRGQLVRLIAECDWCGGGGGRIH